jgi:tetratricopeptide (TPR) repeat protein
MANVLARSGNIDAAIIEFETAIELDPMLAEARNNLAALLFEAGRQAEGLRRLGEAAELLPNAINIQYNYAAALSMSDQLDRAAEVLRTAIERRPDYTPSLYLLGSIEAMRGRYEEALGLFAAVLQRQPNHLDARMDTGRALWELGRYSDAISIFTETLRSAPADRTVAAELAWSLATCPEEKIRNGTHALAIARDLSEQVQHRDPRMLDVLAAAQAETGDFPAAANTTRRAVQIVTQTLAARGATHPREAADAEIFLGQVRERLALYERNRPYRQP